MEQSQPFFKKYIFVCEHVREGNAACCAGKGTQLREYLKEAVGRKGLATRVRVSRTGCLDVCEQGPNVLVMPDNIWYKRVRPEDCDRILDETLKGI